MELWLLLGGIGLPAIATAGLDIRRRTQARTERRAINSYLASILADALPLSLRQPRFRATTYAIPASRSLLPAGAGVATGFAFPTT